MSFKQRLMKLLRLTSKFQPKQTKYRGLHKIIFILLATMSLCVEAQAPQAEQVKLINSSLGEFRFNLINLENRPYSLDSSKAEVQITNATGQLIQKIPIEISFANPSFNFLDLNDDGFIDLLVNTSDLTNGAILPDVFLYIPKLKKFVKSKTLSSVGEIYKSKNHACVIAISDRNTFGATTEEWCFKFKTGRWKMMSSKRDEVSDK